MLRRTMMLTIGTGLTTAALTLAPAATAEPPEDPCDLAITFLCRFMPMAPELDHDVDLTTLPPDDPAVDAALAPADGGGAPPDAGLTPPDVGLIPPP